MKVRLTFALIICMVITSCNFNSRNDLSEYNLNGKINKITSSKYRAVEKFGKIDIDISVESDIENISDFIIENSIIEFDDKGNFLNIKLMDEDDIEYVITQNDTIMDIFYPDQSLYRKIISDKKYSPREKSIYNTNGNLIEKHINTYNESDKLIESKIYDDEGDLTITNNYEYNENNLLQNKIIKGKTYYNYRYHDYTKKISFKYNSNNNISEEIITTDSKVTKYEYKYKYDSEGNWIERIMYVDENPYYVVKRKILYN